MEPRIFFALFALALSVIVLFAIACLMAFRFKQRELQHRERMTAIERGVALPAAESSWGPRTLLLHGMMWLFSGIGLVMFLLAVSASGGREIPASERVHLANYAKSSGASEEQAREIMNDKTQPGLPLGFSLIGLIPIGVGVAYLITYSKENSLTRAS
jgi:amino acid transporter